MSGSPKTIEGQFGEGVEGKAPKQPTVQERFENYTDRASQLSGESFEADWYGDDEPSANDENVPG